MKKIGILGLGVVGKSVLDFFNDKDFQDDPVNLAIWDEFSFSSQISILEFLRSNDLNVISPGIPYKKYEDFYQKFPNRCLGELDLFSKNFCKPVVAVTGSLGKTTIAKLISILLSNPLSHKASKGLSYESNLNVGLGGNIGYPMLNLIKDQKKLDIAILELSSFQLFLNKEFAPKVAIWSNFYPNHLNWHKTEEHYFDSKFKIFEFQKEGQFSLLPIELVNENNIEKFKSLKSTLCFVCDSNIVLAKLHIKKYSIFYVEDDILKYAKVIDYKMVESETIFDLRTLPKFSFIQNWIYAISTVFLLGINLKKLKISSEDFNFREEVFEHRLELFTTINGIDFYNDSKSTVLQATERALQKLNKNDRPIILILGGLSKGVDRSIFIKSLSEEYENLKEIFFFGSESNNYCSNNYCSNNYCFNNYCFNNNCSNLFKNIKTFSSLDAVLKEIKLIAKSGDQILFSPAGSSFDLFDNYMHRGKVFKDLVLKMYTPN